ncbi:MAG: hybrid sensor histidine kinase/response regulator [Cyanobacteria bacterium J06623_5]
MTATQDWNDLSLIGLFRLEVETQVAVLNEHLLTLEKQASNKDPNTLLNNSERLDTLMRAAHSIKGAARIVQIEPAVKVAHSLEDCFMVARQGILQLKSDHIDVLLLAIDFIARLSLIEESALAEQAAVYEDDANTIVLSIESAVAAALRDDSLEGTSVTDRPSKNGPDTTELASQEIRKDISKEILSSPSKDEPEKAPTNTSELTTAIPNTATETAKTAAAIEAIEVKDGAHTSAGEGSERMIRMSADNLNRLMGLAGESLVESNWLQPFATSLLNLKQQQLSVLSLLQRPDQLDNGIDLNEAIQGIQSCHSLLSDQLSDLELFSRRFGQLSDRLYREVIASHMCAFETGTRGYERLVRDLARKLGKQVCLQIEGLTTQVDRDILERLDAPITHLLTNAIAHGLEPPEERLAAGKTESGTVRIEATHRSGMLLITIEDDGKGIDFEQLRKKIMQQGMTPADVVGRLSESELIEFLFLPGFSTANQIDKVSGRGYGLDIARNMVQSVGGALQATSRPGRGTRFQFQLPLTLSVVRSLLFEIAGEPYAMSLARIGRVLRLTPDQIRYSENKPYFSLAGEGERAGLSIRTAKENTGTAENISLVSARQLLGHPVQPEITTALCVVILGEPGSRYGLWVDRLLEERDLVVRPLDGRLGKVPNVSSAALTEKGEPILIMDVADVLQSAAKIAAGKSAFFSSVAALEASQCFNSSTSSTTNSSADRKSNAMAVRARRILVVDDSMTVRAMERKLLQNQGYQVDLAVDGAEGWNIVRMNAYDLVITDVDMPRMSGIELIEHMRAYGPTQNMPVIVVSYKDREADQLAGLEAGANYYLTKSSFHDDGLITAVTDLIGSASSHPQPPAGQAEQLVRPV